MLKLVLLLVTWLACSKATPFGRIVGGIDAVDGEFPHQISLRRSDSHTCGGSIISRNFILTAAHCVGSEDANGNYQVYDPKLFSIRAGSTNRFSGGVLRNVVKIMTHESYGNFLNDVALLELDTPLIFSENIKAIPLASAEVPAGKTVIISGWGRVKTGGDVPVKLQWTTVEAISKNRCLLAIGMSSDALICLAHDANFGACNGDSGGPAIYNGELVGIAGFVVGGCGSRNPDGYAKVYYHVDWIKKHANL